MGRFSPANRPQAIYDPLAETLGNIFQEFRDTPIRQEEMRRRVLENLAREIDIADRDYRAGQTQPVEGEASVVEGPGRRVGGGPASSFDFGAGVPGTPPFTDVEPDPRVLRPRGRTEIGGQGLELAGPVPIEGKPTEAEERRPTFDALPAMFTAGDVRGIMASPEETLAEMQRLMGGRNELPFTEGSVGQFTGRERAAREIGFREQERARGLTEADMERKVTAIMDAAAAQGEPITRQEAVVAAEDLKLPEGEPKQPFEEEGFASEADYLAYLEKKAAATRAPPRPTGTGAAARERRANNYAIRLLEGDENMTLGEAGELTLEATGAAPNLATVKSIMRGGGGEGEIPLNQYEAVVKAWWDQKIPEPEITRRIEADPTLTADQKFELRRYLAELSGRNMPTRPRAAGKDYAAEAVETVLGRTGGTPPARAPGQPPAGVGEGEPPPPEEAGLTASELRAQSARKRRERAEMRKSILEGAFGGPARNIRGQ